MEHPLDNPVWHALAGPHAGFALGTGAARHYPRGMAPFSASSEAKPAAYADLARDLSPGLEARLFRTAEETPPPGRTTESARPIRQMAAGAGELAGSPPMEQRLAPRGPAGAADMLAPAEAAKPGPFGPRMSAPGRFLGSRAPDGRPLAMAGERFLLPGHVELSASAVHPEARGRGLDASLTLRLARDALARGEAPFLRVSADNPTATLHHRLGFRERAALRVPWHRPVAA